MSKKQASRVPPQEINPFELDLKDLSTKDIIKMVGGWNEGHFIFRTGEHGNGYIEKMGFLRYPHVMAELGTRLAHLYDDIRGEIELVIGPSTIGAMLACFVAMELQVPYSLTKKSRKDESTEFHRGCVPDRGTRAIFADDFVFSGKVLKENIAFLQERGVEVMGVSIIGKRHEFPLNVPLRNLLEVDFSKTTPENCEMCASHVLVTASNIRE